MSLGFKPVREVPSGPKSKLHRYLVDVQTEIDRGVSRVEVTDDNEELPSNEEERKKLLNHRYARRQSLSRAIEKFGFEESLVAYTSDGIVYIEDRATYEERQ
jgi:hypothetical protein